jgi:hypothetical protein
MIDTALRKPIRAGSSGESAGRFFLLVGQNLPANAAGLSLACSVACDGTAVSLDAAELFHVDMDHPARRVVFVALNGRLGFEGDGRAMQSWIAICAPVRRWRRKASICAMRSTRRRHAGILMNVHPGPPARELVFRNHSFSARPRMNTLHSFDS